ncbi:MAG TPA: putative baseplate assembly protein, partial [Thermoanaerobaculia bacterium]
LTRLTSTIAGRDTHLPVIAGYGPAAARAAQAAFEVYGGGAKIHPELNELPVYAWGRGKCCLPVGTTRCDVAKNVTALLAKGDFLLLEELHPATLLPDDTQPSHRQVVRLVDVYSVVDPLQPSKELTRLVWQDDDALTFPLCVAVANETGGTTQTGIARGNIVLADHGRTVSSEWFPEAPGPDAKGISLRSGRAFRYFLREGPLSFRIAADGNASAASLRAADPHRAQAQVTELVPSTTAGVPLATGEGTAQTTLLSSNATATHFVVETNNDGRAMIRFGDGVAGMLPPDGSLLRAAYRVGVGPSGNVAPGALAHVVSNGALPIDAVRNPLPSWGGVAPEDLDEVRLTAPAAMRAHSERAVTEDDYARAAMQHPLIASAVATFRWTGTWHTVFVTVDPKGRNELTEELQESVREWLTRYVQTGYDLEIDPPRYVPVELEVEVCVAPGHFRTDVEQAIAAALSRTKGGFFDPDRFSFGEPLYLSQVYAAITSVDGVSSAEVTAFHRYGNPPAGELSRGAIAVGRTEVIRLDNDPNFPDNGLLKLSLRSGK